MYAIAHNSLTGQYLVIVYGQEEALDNNVHIIIVEVLLIRVDGIVAEAD